MTATTAVTRATLIAYRNHVSALKDASMRHRDAIEAEQQIISSDKSSQAEKEVATARVKAETKTVANHFIDTLISRDDLDDDIQPPSPNIVADIDEMNQISDLDQQLREQAKVLYEHSWVDLSGWRKVRRKKANRWWWKLDSVLVDVGWSHLWTWSGLLQIVISVLLIWFTYEQTRTGIDTLFNATTQFVTSHIQEVGLEVVSIAAFVVQLALSIRIALAFTGTALRTINQWLVKYQGSYRREVVAVLPISPVLVSSALFCAILYGVVWTTNSLIKELQRGEGQTESSVTLEVGREIDSLLGEGSDYTSYTLLLGLQSEDRGDYEAARNHYRDVLVRTPAALVAYYRLSRLYLEQRIETDKSSEQLQRIALDLLDSGLRHVQESKRLTDPAALHATYALNHVENIAQMEFLLRITRAEVFLSLGQPRGARLEVGEAEVVIRNNPALFSPSIVADAEVAIPPLSVTTLYYVDARALTSLWETADDAQAESYRSLAIEAWNQVERMSDRRIGRERLWLLEADQAKERLQQRS